jgi:hypothetical protein
VFRFFARFACGLLAKAVQKLDTALSVEPTSVGLPMECGQLSIALSLEASAAFSVTQATEHGLRFLLKFDGVPELALADDSFPDRSLETLTPYSYVAIDRYWEISRATQSGGKWIEV